jgi:SAM-dependent methyltransferase
MSNHNCAPPSAEDAVEEEEEVQEEVWDFDGILSGDKMNPAMETHVIRLCTSKHHHNHDHDHDNNNNNNNNNSLIYKSVATHQLTPLDMTYDDDDDNDDEYTTTNIKKEYYDGTGTIVWMAALVILPVILSSHNNSKSNNRNNDKDNDNKHSYFEDCRVCELGCGAGVAGMAIWKFHNPSLVVFSDNDPKALELCRGNCQLNSIDSSSSLSSSEHYKEVRYEILEWVQDDNDNDDDDNDENESEKESSPSSLSSLSFWKENTASFDTIVATDVLYEIVMIPPLLETAVRLLKPSGYFWLSHVPRFYLPKKEKVDPPPQAEYPTYSSSNSFDDDGGCGGDDTAAAIALERHIQQEAAKVGLALVETIRPDQLCALAATTLESSSYFSLDKLEEMHAVVFLFQLFQTKTTNKND